MFKATN